VEPQQLATKVAQLETRVSTLEDEGKILRGEVKQVLTEIRSAVLVRDNPFEGETALAGAPAPHMANTVVATPAPQIHLHAEQPAPEPRPEPVAPPPHAPEPPAREPVPIRQAVVAPPPEPEPKRPNWSLLTIAGLTAWAEDAMRRIGSLRLEILLDLCEAAGHISPEAREAMSRVAELDIPEPQQPPTTNETVMVLRQLDALVNDGDEEGASARLQRMVA
jgi:hypothetical protein